MTDGIDLHSSLESTLQQADAAIKQLRIDGKSMARAAADYRIAVAEKELFLKDSTGLAANLIHDCARGDRDVAELYYRRLVQETILDATREEIMLRKREADIIREQISREWSQSGWQR